MPRGPRLIAAGSHPTLLLLPQITVLWCKSCLRYLQPPKHWLKADLGGCVGASLSSAGAAAAMRGLTSPSSLLLPLLWHRRRVQGAADVLHQASAGAGKSQARGRRLHLDGAAQVRRCEVWGRRCHRRRACPSSYGRSELLSSISRSHASSVPSRP